MTNEMQLAHAAGLPAIGHEQHAHHTPGPVKPVGFKKIHRLLRGRYPLAIGLGLVCAAGFGAAGYLATKPMFQGQVTIEIETTVPNANTPIDTAIQNVQMDLESAANRITSPDMFQQSISSDAWRSAGGPTSDEAVAAMESNTEAKLRPGTNIIDITYNDPNEKLAVAGAKAISDAYKNYFNSTNPQLINRKLEYLHGQEQTLNFTEETYRSQLRDETAKYGTEDLEAYQTGQIEALSHLQDAMNDDQVKYDQALATANAIKGQATPGNTDAPKLQILTPEQISGVDPQMLKMLTGRQDLQNHIQYLIINGYGPNHPTVVALRNELQVSNTNIQQYADNWNQTNRLSGGRTGPGAIVNLQNDLVEKQAELKLVTQQFKQQQQTVTQIGQEAQVITDLKDKIAKTDADLASNHANESLLSSTQSLMQGLNVSQAVLAPEPAIDRRKQLAALGVVGGALLPTFILVLIGLMDGRFRYSDETNTDLDGAPLLGILPNLPDLLTDPAQAATAAHCVHQIRTILQITGHSVDRRAFTVTSGSPGEGKTSLTLALGLSFAASGSKTLLIDGDLVGGGLTARLNVSAEHGVLEAMASRDILPFVRATDVADLSFLPIGRAMAGYTGAISPAAVRRLVNEARNHFDVILIDTGPILGSIEASPMSVASDGVVLCVSRGQQRGLVEKALAHLRSIGAKLAGVVFNRAQPQDFERSISRLGVESVGAANGNGSSRSEPIGPVAKAVASSVRPTAGTRK